MELQHIALTKITGNGFSPVEDVVAVEAHFSVIVNGTPAFSFTCTPSNLEEMVTGALYTRGYLTDAAQMDCIQITETQILVTLHDGRESAKGREISKPRLDIQTIFQTVKSVFSDPDTLFNRTGCAHSCSLMRNGEIICTFEDIGRHNALDKVIGYVLRENIPRKECAIFTSGRISGDYMTKIIHAGFPIAVSRAAVTSEAVRLAKEHCVTLYGFVRGNSANLYNP